MSEAMRRHGGWAARGRALLALAVLAAAGALLPGAAEAQRLSRVGEADCVVCHGELELLRQSVPSLSLARQMVVTPQQLQGSAHDGMGCVECHDGFTRYPHPQAASTSTCASCHTDADHDWAAGLHAREATDGTIAATCRGCHGVHEMAPVAALAEDGPMLRMNAQCVACHAENALPPDDPHRDEVGCWTCHAPHRVLAQDDPRAAIAPMQQPRTCGACHDSATVSWRGDAHGAATLAGVAQLGGALGLPTPREAPVCTGCHGGHGMLSPDSTGFLDASVRMCQGCHAYETDTFFGSYHGKATALGSRVSAGCHDCHGAHDVFAADDARSMVHAANVLDTCRDCHENARPRLTSYDSHPDPFNPERNVWIFGAFWFMNLLLFGVMGVFGLHTALWWVRLYLDKRRGILHGPHHHHSHSHGGADDAHGPAGRAEP